MSFNVPVCYAVSKTNVSTLKPIILFLNRLLIYRYELVFTLSNIKVKTNSMISSTVNLLRLLFGWDEVRIIIIYNTNT